MLQFYRSEAQIELARFSAQGLTRLKSRSQLSWALIWRLGVSINFQVHSGCWQNLFLCSSRSEVPFLLSSQGRSLLLERLPTFLQSWPLHLQGSNGIVSPSRVLNFSSFPFLTARESSLLVRTHMIRSK